MDTRKSITWKNFKVGDYIICQTGDRAKIMAVNGEIFARSSWQQFDVFSRWEGIEDAKRLGYRFIQKGNKTEMTVQELETLLGHPIKVI